MTIPPSRKPRAPIPEGFSKVATDTLGGDICHREGLHEPPSDCEEAVQLIANTRDGPTGMIAISIHRDIMATLDCDPRITRAERGKVCLQLLLAMVDTGSETLTDCQILSRLTGRDIAEFEVVDMGAPN